MTSRRLSQYLRRGDDADLRRRRAVVGLSLASAAAMGVIAAYQVGLIRRLPEPPIPGFDAEAVVGSPDAYRRLGTPDGLLGLASFAGTAILAAAGGHDRARAHPLLSLSMAGKVLFDAGNALKLAWDEWAKHGAFCLYCLLATACTLGSLPLVVPEAREALGQLFGGKETRRAPAGAASAATGRRTACIPS